MESKEYVYAQKLLNISNINNKDLLNQFFCHSEREKFIEVSVELRNTIDWNFKFADFYKIICSSHYLPLEFLWNLHLFQIMPLDVYISNIYENKKVLQSFQEGIIALCTQELEEKEIEYLIQTGYLAFLVQKSFSSMDDLVPNERHREVYLDTVERLLKVLFSVEPSVIENRRHSGFYSLWNAGIVEEASLQAFCSYAINYYLKSLPPSNDLEVFEIFESKETPSSRHILTLLQKLVKTQIFESLSHFLKNQNLEINVKCVLNIVRAILNAQPESLVPMQKLIAEILNDALEKLSYDMLLRALLMARQATYKTGTPPQVSYKKWLQIIFKDHGYLKDVEGFSLLIQVLSDFVPFYKSIDCLKVAVEFNISAPPEVQVLYNDYIILLKTRIQDLKPHIKPEETVEKALSLFEILGKIPPVIMETSLLQKHKFLNEFLPALLTPRVVPHIPDVKEKFIDALNKAGKIPSNLLENYRRGCQEEEKLLISDINMTDDIFQEDSDVIVLD